VINYCLEANNLSIDDLDYIIVDYTIDLVNMDLLRKITPIKNKEKICFLPHPFHHLTHDFSGFLFSL
jgi:hypothetical protein